MKLFKFEIQICAQILCAHKPYFLMPGHIFTWNFLTIYVPFQNYCMAQQNNKFPFCKHQKMCSIFMDLWVNILKTFTTIQIFIFPSFIVDI